MGRNPMLKPRILNFLWPLYLLLGSLQSAAQSLPVAIRDVSPQDLAIILPPTLDPHLRISMSDTLFPQNWWETALKLYQQTSVEDALTLENRLEDWQLVALRFAPCQPLLPYLTPVNHKFCHAEIRLVWQPFLMTRTSIWNYDADDRAFHVTYRLKGAHALSPNEETVYRGLQKVQNPTPTDLATYEALHKRVVTKTLSDLKNLATSALSETLEVRPEFLTPHQGTLFINRLQSFLQQEATLGQVAEVTGFSLPEGRDPPLLDDWVFVAFDPTDAGRSLKPKNILLKSGIDGRVLLDFGPATSISMHLDDPRIDDMINQLGDADAKEVEANTILKFKDKRTKRSKIADAESTHVSHTTCGSCHKLNSQPFDFHNLSYFRNHDVTIGPRVHLDVSRDLQWLRSQTNSW